MVDQRIHIMFAGGGTGGHLYPGLAVAEELAERVPGCRLSFCGTGREWERTVVARCGFEYRALPAKPLVASPFGVIRTLLSHGVAYRMARRWVQTEAPSVVVGLGGYVSVPLGLA